MKLPFLLMAAALAVQTNGRVVTPNGDGINDAVTFQFPGGGLSTPQTQVYSLQGRRITALTPSSGSSYAWDGRDSSGRVVESGVYLVQIRDQGASWNGVIAVAK